MEAINSEVTFYLEPDHGKATQSDTLRLGEELI